MTAVRPASEAVSWLRPTMEVEEVRVHVATVPGTNHHVQRAQLLRSRLELAAQQAGLSNGVHHAPAEPRTEPSTPSRDKTPSHATQPLTPERSPHTPNLYAGLFGNEFSLEKRESASKEAHHRESQDRLPQTPSRKGERRTVAPFSVGSPSSGPTSARLAQIANAPQLGSPHRADARGVGDLHNHPTQELLEREQMGAWRTVQPPSKRRRLPTADGEIPVRSVQSTASDVFGTPSRSWTRNARSGDAARHLPPLPQRLPNGHPASSLAQGLGLSSGGSGGFRRPAYVPRRHGGGHTRVLSTSSLPDPHATLDAEQTSPHGPSAAGPSSTPRRAAPPAEREPDQETAEAMLHLAGSPVRRKARNAPRPGAAPSLPPPGARSAEEPAYRRALRDQHPSGAGASEESNAKDETRWNARLHRRSASHSAQDTLVPIPTSHDRSGAITTPPADTSSTMPSTPKTIGNHFSYGEYLNMSPSPQPRSTHSRLISSERRPGPMLPDGKLPSEATPLRARGHARHRSDDLGFRHARPLWAQPLGDTPRRPPRPHDPV